MNGLYEVVGSAVWHTRRCQHPGGALRAHYTYGRVTTPGVVGGLKNKPISQALMLEPKWQCLIMSLEKTQGLIMSMFHERSMFYYVPMYTIRVDPLLGIGAELKQMETFKQPQS